MLNPTQTVAVIVLDHSETAAVFERHKIDYCCHGDQSVTDACARDGIDEAVVIRELEEAIAARVDHGDDPRALATEALIDHIVARHHAYVRETLPRLLPLASKVASVHGARQPRLQELRDAMNELAETILPHLDEEERVLFPALRAGAPDRAAVARELASMEDEHRAVGELLRTMRVATDDYEVPEWACRSYRTLFTETTRLEQDVLRHVHLENHVLAPRFAAA